jgi:hypothetical protein
LASMHLSVTRVRVDNDELEPDVTAGDLEVIRNDRGEVPGLLTWSLTFLTADEPWHHGLGECQLVIDVDGGRRFRGRAVLVRSDEGRWHYFNGVGKLEGPEPSRSDSRTD